MATDKEFVNRVKDATDLVALIGQSVKLRKQGSAWVGLCPFHSERSGSFQVVGDRGFYHCFGCGKHGDALDWMVEREGLSFGEALETLAAQAGVPVPAQRVRPAKEIDLEARMRDVLDAAQQYFVRQLQENAKAKDYLSKRGMTPAFVATAGLGYAPDEWEALVTHLRKLDFSPELIEQAGLASRSQRGNLIDFMRDRLIIPIQDPRGRVVAFGGRAFGDVQPKYLNTRDTPLFSKGNLLFGMNRAKGSLRDGGIVVEGYFDVLTLHQEGLTNTVAPLGTALTEQHLQALGRTTKRLTYCFDGDSAGIRAAEKGLRLALPLGFDVRIFLLPKGEDPDTYCMKVGGETYREMVRNAPDWTGFVMERAMEGRDPRRLQDRMAMLHDLTEFLVYLPDSIEHRPFLSSLAHQLQMPMEEVDRAIKTRKDKAVVADSADSYGEDGDPGPEPPPDLPTGFEAAEPRIDEQILPMLILCHDAASREKIAQVPTAWWEHLDGAPLLQCLLDAEGDEDRIPIGARATFRRLMASWATTEDAEKPLERTLVRLEQTYVHREIQTLTRQIQEPTFAGGDKSVLAGAQTLITNLLTRKSQLQKRMRSMGPVIG
jgi:DNA primase